MTNLNHNTMSVSDKLAMKLQESELGSLLSEDDIILIAREAIDKAFFKNRIDNSGYNTKTADPLIVEMAREAFRVEFAKIVKPVIDEFTKSEAFLETLAAAIHQQLPSVLTSMVSSTIYSQAQNAMEGSMSNYDFMRRFKQALMNTP